MWSVTLRDLQYRKRRFAIGAVGAGLVFAMALTLAGMSEGFRVEAERTISAVGADRWVMPVGAGPFTSFTTISDRTVTAVDRLPGVDRADPLVIVRHVAHLGGDPADVFLLGYRPGGLGEPDPSAGRVPSGTGEAVTDRKLGYAPGDEIRIGGRTLTVVGTVDGFTMNAGIPNVYAPLDDARAIAFDGARAATAIVTRGVPQRTPLGLAALRNEQGVADALRPLANARDSIDSSTAFLWVVAAIIIGTIVYLTTLERLRDFAVLKAIGASSRDLFLGLALQSVIVALAAAAIAAVAAFLLVPLFPMLVEIPARAFAVLPAIAVGVGVLASTAGLRRAIKVDPALAFGSV